MSIGRKHPLGWNITVSCPWVLASWCLSERFSFRRGVGVVVVEQAVGDCEAEEARRILRVRLHVVAFDLK